MPSPPAAVMVASLMTLTFPGTLESGVWLSLGTYPAKIPAGGYSATIGRRVGPRIDGAIGRYRNGAARRLRRGQADGNDSDAAGRDDVARRHHDRDIAGVQAERLDAEEPVRSSRGRYGGVRPDVHRHVTGAAAVRVGGDAVLCAADGGTRDSARRRNCRSP